MAATLIEKIIQDSKSKAIAGVFSVGDTVKVHSRIKEGDKERLQVFTGTVVAKKGRGGGETFTVRRISHGVGVEKIFPVRSPNVAKVEVATRGSVRRAKLYYLRSMAGKKAAAKLRARPSEAGPQLPDEAPPPDAVVEPAADAVQTAK